MIRVGTYYILFWEVSDFICSQGKYVSWALFDDIAGKQV